MTTHSSRGPNRRRFLSTSAAAAPLLGVAGMSAVPQETAERSSRHAFPRIRIGAEVLAREQWARLRGRRVGVITNPTGVLDDLTHLVDAGQASGAVEFVAVFGPEHGFRGTAQAGGSEGDYRDPRTGLPVYDAYRADAAKLAQMFREAGVEQIVFDIADVGARFYTYIWTMYAAMLAAARIGVEFVVLDRPNPLGGEAFGPVLDPRFASSIGREPIAQQHGMTVGELARMFNAEFVPQREGRGVERLDVVRMEGWSRRESFPATGLSWVPPSPNIPSPTTAALYPGTGMFEGTTFSEGRGTAQPFEVIGAPGIDWRWAQELNAASPLGVSFRETYFVPAFSKHRSQTCGGVQLHVDGPDGELDPISVATTMLATARRLYPDVFDWRNDLAIDQLTGSDRFRKMLDSGAGPAEIVAAWRDELEGFRERRRPYLLYG